MKAVCLLFALIVALVSVPLSASVFVSIADELPATLPPGTAYTAKSTGGPWHLGSTWVQGTPPGPGSVVTIPAGVTVRIEHFENDSLNAPKWVRVQGRLEVSNTMSTRFYVETIHVTPTGTFALGSPAAPLPANLLAEIIFTSDGPINRSWDKEQISRGLVAEGPVKVYGASRGVGYLGVTTDVPKNASTMSLAGTPWNWQAGDEVVLTGTYFRRSRPSQEEVRHISSIAPSMLTVDVPYTYDHLRVSTAGVATPNLHIANLTRNVQFKSNSTAIGDRGHIILNHLDSEIQWAAFINLGRTDKSTKLDDFLVGATSTSKQPDPLQVNNRRGRYSLHVHKTGWGPSLTTPPTNIIGCVVNNTPGWGFVNHSSNVNFQQNVAYDFFGAGFVTEDGDELGTFTSDIAIKGRGTGEFSTRKFRINFQHPTRKQALADFGFMGDGFWFNGPAIRVNGAVANGCNGRGMIWHTTGAVSPSTATTTGNPPYPFGRYSFFPKNQIANVFGSTYPAAASLVPRTWQGDPNRAIIADLPILQCTNVQSYGNFIGFHLRFNNHQAVAWYTEDPFNYDDQIIPVPGQPNTSVPTRVRENISDLKLWNNEEALAMRYASFATLTTVTAINRLDYDETAANDPSINPIYGAENFSVLNDMTFNGLTIDGWDVAHFLAEITADANGNPVTSSGANFVLNTPVYRNYALTGTWDKRANATPCALPTLNNVAVTLNKQSATLSWNGSAGKYLIRYRIDGSQQWTYAETNASTKSLVITTTPSRNYSWQVMGGCTNTLSNWTGKGTFNTF